MKRKIMGVLVLSVIVLSVIINPFKTEAEKNSDLKLVGVKLKEAEENYINYMAPIFLQDMKENKTQYSFECEDVQNLVLGEPLAIFHFSEGNLEEEVSYYIPVYEKGKMVHALLLLRNKSDDGEILNYGMQTTNNLVDELNYLVYESGWQGICYLVGAEDCLYAINSTTEINLTTQTIEPSNEISEEIIRKQLEIVNDIEVYFQEEKEFIEEKELFVEDESMKNMEKEVKDITNKNTRATNRIKILFDATGTYGVKQELDDACWMACIATTGRYVRRSENLNWNVENMYWSLGLEYPSGGNGGSDLQVKSVLRKYLLKYDYAGPSKGKIMNSIDSGYPVLLRGKNVSKDNENVVWHMITIRGYNENANLAYYWDPKPGVYTSVTMGTPFVTEGYANCTFKWQTIHYYTGTQYK